MIVCVCNNVSEKKIRIAVDSGATSMKDLRDQLGVGNCCGKCNGCAKQVLRESLCAAADSRHFHAQELVLRTEAHADPLAA